MYAPRIPPIAPDAPRLGIVEFRRDRELQRRRCQPTQHVEERVDDVAETVLDVVPEDPEEEHVAGEVEPSPVQEHRDEHREPPALVRTLLPLEASWYGDPAPGPRLRIEREPRLEPPARGSPGARPPTGSRRGRSRTPAAPARSRTYGCHNRNTATLAAISAIVTTGTRCVGFASRSGITGGSVRRRPTRTLPREVSADVSWDVLRALVRDRHRRRGG